MPGKWEYANHMKPLTYNQISLDLPGEREYATSPNGITLTQTDVETIKQIVTTLHGLRGTCRCEADDSYETLRLRARAYQRAYTQLLSMLNNGTLVR